jgi:glutathione synthase
MPHLFIIDPIEKLNLPLDTSLHLAASLIRSNEDVHLCAPWDLSLHKEGLRVQTRRLLKFSTDLAQINLGPVVTMAGGQFSHIYVRKDPPYDLAYVAMTWLLDFVPSTAKVYNSPKSLRDFNEKLAIFHFPEACDKAIFTADPQKLASFLVSEAGGDAVLKPIDLYGGRDVIRIQKSQASEQDILDLLTKTTAGGSQPRLMQPFNHKIFEGEVRAFYAEGEPIAWCLKKPKDQNFLANTAAGATLHPFTPSQNLEKLVTGVARKLLSQGVSFVGFDVIGEFISEINITSPRLLASEKEKSPYFDKIAKLVLR